MDEKDFLGGWIEELGLYSHEDEAKPLGECMDFLLVSKPSGHNGFVRVSENIGGQFWRNRVSDEFPESYAYCLPQGGRDFLTNAPLAFRYAVEELQKCVADMHAAGEDYDFEKTHPARKVIQTALVQAGVPESEAEFCIPVIEEETTTPRTAPRPC